MIFMTTKIHSAKRLLELLTAFISFLTTKVKQENEGGDYIASFLIINGEGNSCLNAFDYILIITSPSSFLNTPDSVTEKYLYADHKPFSPDH